MKSLKHSSVQSPAIGTCVVCTCTTTIVHNKHYVLMAVSEISILKG